MALLLTIELVTDIKDVPGPKKKSLNLRARKRMERGRVYEKGWERYWDSFEKDSEVLSSTNVISERNFRQLHKFFDFLSKCYCFPNEIQPRRESRGPREYRAGLESNEDFLIKSITEGLLKSKLTLLNIPIPNFSKDGCSVKWLVIILV